MATYTVRDKETNKTITFKWTGASPPTDADMEEVFTQARTVGPITTGIQLEQAQVSETGRQAIIGERRIQAMKEKALEEVPELAGGVAGGLLGTVGGFGVGGVPGAIGGAGLGGAFGKALQQISRRIRGEEAPEAPLEAAKEIGISGARQAAFEAGGRFAVGTVGKVLAPFRKSITPEAQVAERTLDRFMPKATGFISKRLGLRQPAVLPAEATENKTLDVLQNIAEGSLLGGGKIQAFKTKVRPQAVNDMLDDFITMFGERADADMVASAFDMAVKGEIKASRLVTTPMYKTVERMVSETTMIGKGALGEPVVRPLTIGMGNVKEFASPLLKRAKEIGSVEAKNAGDDLVRAVMELPNRVPYETAQDLRSRLLSRVDEFSVINKKAPAIGKAKQLTARIDNAIETTLQQNNPEALKIWRQANQLYKETSKQHDNAFIRKLVKMEEFKPEAIARNTFKTITSARFVRNAVDDKTWTKLKSSYVQERLGKSVASGTVDVSGIKLFDATFGRNGLGDKALREIFNPQEFLHFKDIVTSLKVLEERQAEGAGKVAISLMQPASVISWITGRARVLATFILGGPAVVSRMFTNPLMAKYLKSTVKLPAGSPEVGAMLTKIGALAFQIEREMKSKGEIPVTVGDLQKLKEQGRLPEISTLR